MGLFGKRTETKPIAKSGLAITDDDRRWVDVCFKWLLKLYGHPVKGSVPVLFNEKCFPVTFKAKQITVNNLLDDLCSLMAMDRSKIWYTLIKDVRDIPGTPYQIYGKAFESTTETTIENGTKRYVIHVANSITNSELLLLRRLILELVHIKSVEKTPDAVEGRDTTHVDYIASVFFGFGALVSKSLIDFGMSYNAGWQTTWKNKAEVPPEIIAYALANYSKLIGEDTSVWVNELSSYIKEKYLSSLEYLENNPDENTYLDAEAFENDLKAKAYQERGKNFRKEHKEKEAFEEYDKAILLAKDKNLLALLYINAGYCLLMIDEYEKSLQYYSKALEFKPGYDYAYANMGYIFTMTGELDKAKEYLEKVNPYDKALTAYLLRDWAVYYMKNGDNTLAENNFQKAFEMNYPIELLEYFYAQFLLYKSAKEVAMQYLQISVDKGEPKGIELMKSLQNG